MALQVITTLSTSRAGIELESSSSSSSSNKAASKTTTPTPTPQPHLNKYFRMSLVELLKMLDSNKVLLEKKGSFIIRLESAQSHCEPVLFAIRVCMSVDPLLEA